MPCTAVAQLECIWHMSQRSRVRYPVWPHIPSTYLVSPSADSRRAVVSYWLKYVHQVLVNQLGGLSLPRKSVVRLIDCPDMTVAVYRGRKTTTQQQRCCIIIMQCTKNTDIFWTVKLIVKYQINIYRYIVFPVNIKAKTGNLFFWNLLMS